MAVESTIEIRRMSLDYRVARDHGAPEDVRRRLDDVVRDHLATALQKVFAPFDASDPTDVLVIKKLEVNVELDASNDASAIASAWAARMATVLAKALRTPSEMSGMLHFRDDAHYLGRFLLALAEGNAWTKWYYRRFDGLRPLPAPAAIRTALLERLGVGLGALRSLERADFARVAAALGERESRRVVLAAERTPELGDWELAAGAVLRAAPFVRSLSLGAGDAWQRALALLAVAASELEEERVHEIARLAEAVSITGAVRTLPSGLEKRAVAEEAISRARQVLGHITDRVRAELESALVERRAEPAEAIWTPFGGLFLLLSRAASWSWPEGRAGAILRLLVLARCTGPAHRARAESDRAVRWMAGVPDEREGADFALAAEAADALASRCEDDERLRRVRDELGGDTVAKLAAALLIDFARGLPGFADSSPGHLFRRFLDFDAALEAREDGYVAVLGRAQLHTLLVFTGAVRGTIHAPWLGAPLRLTSRG